MAKRTRCDYGAIGYGKLLEAIIDVGAAGTAFCMGRYSHGLADYILLYSLLSAVGIKREWVDACAFG